MILFSQCYCSIVGIQVNVRIKDKYDRDTEAVLCSGNHRIQVLCRLLAIAGLLVVNAVLNGL